MPTNVVYTSEIYVKSMFLGSLLLVTEVLGIFSGILAQKFERKLQKIDVLRIFHQFCCYQQPVCSVSANIGVTGKQLLMLRMYYNFGTFC